MPNPTCSTCRWWVAIDVPPGQPMLGHCHRLPPKEGPKWPVTIPSDFCGEHQPKDEEDA